MAQIRKIRKISRQDRKPTESEEAEQAEQQQPSGELQTAEQPKGEQLTDENMTDEEREMFEEWEAEEQPPKEKLLLCSQDLATLFSVSRMTINRWRLSGWLPKPVQITESSTYWLRTTIDAWIKAGHPTSDPRLARAAIRRCQELGEDFNDWIAPKSAPEDGKYLPEVEKLLDEFEERMNKVELFVQQGEPVLPPKGNRVRFLVHRLQELLKILDNPETSD